MFQKLKIIDSHTGGEPTRAIIDGMPDLGPGSMAERREILSKQHDWLRRATVLEPRGFEAIVGAALQESTLPNCTAGVIFFNNAGYLNMCVHGIIGLAITLKHMGRIDTGVHRIETPVGIVIVKLNEDDSVSVENVRSYRTEKDVEIPVPEFGPIVGDIAWGGNWFFIIDGQGPVVDYANIKELTHFCINAREALSIAGITGNAGAAIDHIEIFAPANESIADSRNFVLCPGDEYDRSPCGTGLSARLACLADSGLLRPNQSYLQASIINTLMEGSFRSDGEKAVIPTITAKAWLTGECVLAIDPDDPLKHGIDDRSITRLANEIKPEPAISQQPQ